jgi:hypothetical protein
VCVSLRFDSTITYVPGLYKIFDEILVNAADNKVSLIPRTALASWAYRLIAQAVAK